MKAITTRMRLTSLLLAVAMSAAVLGGTVAGMQSGVSAEPAMVVMEKVTITATAVN